MSDETTEETTTNDQERIADGVNHSGATPELVSVLYDRLVGLHRRCGAEGVLYVTENGEVRTYHPNRYLQGLRRARDAGDVIGYCERIALAPRSRGFNILLVAGRLDLTVEAVVIDPEFVVLFTDDAYAVAGERLASAAAGRVS